MMKPDIFINYKNLSLSLTIKDSVESQATVHVILNIKAFFLEKGFIELNKEVWFDFDEWDTFLINLKKSKEACLVSSNSEFKMSVMSDRSVFDFTTEILSSSVDFKFCFTDSNLAKIIENEFENFPKWW